MREERRTRRLGRATLVVEGQACLDWRYWGASRLRPLNAAIVRSKLKFVLIFTPNLATLHPWISFTSPIPR